ncbi:MAG: phosphate ABC transporter permease subunit PstC [Phycisphaerae bacterium]|jgi:phosphate transport system permease protein|nr:phosphate ABC transporter permease subunit PstC [Phycisphaerae bacterium]MCZ2400346.1 phosphate ABC transporter permease subunit PstC [Phycisphaerae bacterium]NUQ49383.1 phosphate ABC transporter permease subunit PstC [Phycisphaerae bacterium]
MGQLVDSGLGTPRALRPRGPAQKLRAGEAVFRPSRVRRLGERAIEFVLLLAALSSVLVTLGIVGLLVFESLPFFRHVSPIEFLTGTEWTPLFANARFGVLPLVAGTLVTTVVALLVAVPVGTVCAVWLSEYASPRVRELVKPVLELLSAVPTVVFGYFALLFVTPALQRVIPWLPSFNMLSAGLVMGIMVIPYVTSLSEEAMRAVPRALREGAYALGATRIQVAWRIVFPAALSGATAAYILTVSRALGETMIVAIAAGMQPTLTLDPTKPAATLTAFIVQVSLGDLPHGSVGYQSIFAVGLVLMLITLTLNVLGYLIQRRYREAY